MHGYQQQQKHPKGLSSMNRIVSYEYTFWRKDGHNPQGKTFTFYTARGLQWSYILFCECLRNYRIPINRTEFRVVMVNDVFWLLREGYFNKNKKLIYLPFEETCQRLSDIGIQPDVPPWIIKDDIETE